MELELLLLQHTFCYIVYHLLTHYPEVQKRMVRELDNVIGSDRDGRITFDQVLNKLEYTVGTDAIFKEGLLFLYLLILNPY